MRIVPFAAVDRRSEKLAVEFGDAGAGAESVGPALKAVHDPHFAIRAEREDRAAAVCASFVGGSIEAAVDIRQLRVRIRSAFTRKEVEERVTLCGLIRPMRAGEAAGFHRIQPGLPLAAAREDGRKKPRET